MKIRLILATSDKEYAERFAAGVSDSHGTMEISVCTNLEKLGELVQEEYYDICLADPEALAKFNHDFVKLTVTLWNTHANGALGENTPHRVRKYQRISSIVSQLIRMYADVADKSALSGNPADITVVWSPSGGCGKTTVAVAYAASLAHKGKSVTYLNIEHFSSTNVLFSQPATSLSVAFEQMANNMGLQLLSMRATDPATGINYFGAPDNYDDMNVLTGEDFVQIVNAAAEHSDELVVDLSAVCDARTTAMFNRATRILLVTDYSRTSEAKLCQFMSQSNTYHKYRSKMTLVANKGAAAKNSEGVSVIRLPWIESKDTVAVYSKLSEYIK